MTNLTSSIVSVKQNNIGLVEGGAGQTVLYLHGANVSAGPTPFIEQLAETFHVLAPEHPGFGRSDEPEWLRDIHDTAYYYLDFLEKFDLQDIHLVGSSLGGWIAMEIAIRDQSRIKSLSLSAPAGIIVPEKPVTDIFLLERQELIHALVHDPSLAEKMLSVEPDEASAEQELKNLFTTARLAWEPRFHNPQLAKWLHRIRIPTQILWGECDAIIHPSYQQELKRLLPHAELHHFPNCGHLPHIECTEKFVAAIKTFIERI